ncbi:MAG: ABC transporter ATP-binding protein [Gammaproteobacteria bacterium]|nr:ABC transporter ATP-binding protein [Gammaproteobacteria bacterium]
MTDKHPLINVNGLTKMFGELKALDGVSFSIEPGEVVALLGANGAGKTTLINHLLARVTPDSGTISVANHKPGSYAARQLIGTVLQATQIPSNLTIYEHIELFTSYYPNPMTIEETLSLASLDALKNRYFDTLSGGQQQRVFFALAVCGNPNIILLDEPTVGLDVNARREFWNCITELKSRGTAILLTTHYLEEADALADRILVLADGKLVQQGTSESIKQKLGGKRIRFRSTKTIAEWESSIDMVRFDLRGGYFDVISESPEKLLCALLKTDPDLFDLTVDQISLEDAFLNLSVLGTKHLSTSAITSKEHAA